MKDKKVVVGGTFDVLHEGHKALLRRAFSLGEPAIGLTSDSMAQKSRNREVLKFAERKKTLEDFIKEEFGGANFKIFQIENVFGPTLQEDFDYIVVSPETYPTAVLINEERRKAGRKPMEIVAINFVLGGGGRPISATKLRH